MMEVTLSKNQQIVLDIFKSEKVVKLKRLRGIYTHSNGLKACLIRLVRLNYIKFKGYNIWELIE